MNIGKLQLRDHPYLGSGFKSFVDRKMRERRRNERQLAERRTMKHCLEAKNSCVADARSYRIASHRFKQWVRAMAQ
jgi:hypothetical protein